jgi:hypothetical protein
MSFNEMEADLNFIFVYFPTSIFFEKNNQEVKRFLSYRSSGVIGHFFVINGRETDLERVSLVVAVTDLSPVPLSGAVLLIDDGRVIVVVVSSVAVDVDVQVVAVALSQLVARREAPLLVQFLKSGDDASLQNSLSGIVTEDVGEVVQLQLEDLLGGLSLGAGGVDEGSDCWVATLGVGVRPPEAFSSTSVELRNRS